MLSSEISRLPTVLQLEAEYPGEWPVRTNLHMCVLHLRAFNESVTKEKVH